MTETVTEAPAPVYFTARDGELLPLCQPESPVAEDALAASPGARDYYASRDAIVALGITRTPEAAAWAEAVDALRMAQAEHLAFLLQPGSMPSVSALERAEGEPMIYARATVEAPALNALPEDPADATQRRAMQQLISYGAKPEDMPDSPDRADIPELEGTVVLPPALESVPGLPELTAGDTDHPADTGQEAI